MKRTFILLLFSLLFGALSLSAQKIEVNSIFYQIINKEAIVVRPDNNYMYAGVMVIPDSIEVEEYGECNKYPVTGIGEMAFVNMDQIDSVGFPATMRTIGYSAFANCTNLNKVVLPDSLIQLGATSFRGCKSLNDIIIPNKISLIENGAFANCGQLKSVTLGEKVKIIESGAFWDAPITEINCLGTTPPEVMYDSFTGIGSFF